MADPTKLRPRAVVPTGHELRRGTHGIALVDVYPPHPKGEAIYVLRLHFDLDLRTAAKLLGLRPSDLSDIENGRASLTDAEWSHVFRALTALPPKSMLLPAERGSHG